MKEYFIITETSGLALIQSVNRYIKYGWEPLGGVGVDTHVDRVYYHQAIVKEITNEQ